MWLEGMRVLQREVLSLAGLLAAQAEEALPELELEELMQHRPLELQVGTISSSPRTRPWDIVRQKGVAKFSSAMSSETAQELLDFMSHGVSWYDVMLLKMYLSVLAASSCHVWPRHLEYRRCIHAGIEDKAVLQQFFSNVQVPRASLNLRIFLQTAARASCHYGHIFDHSHSQVSISKHVPVLQGSVYLSISYLNISQYILVCLSVLNLAVSGSSISI